LSSHPLLNQTGSLSARRGYPLPEGLPDGGVVRVIAFVPAYRLVEWQGKQFKVYMANMQPGLEELRPGT